MNVAALMSNAKDALMRGNREGASDLLNFGILKLAELTLDGTSHVEGASVDRWKERFWYELESNNLMED
jgi:hypothetical protein